jgi:hypothetical protein
MKTNFDNDGALVERHDSVQDVLIVFLIYNSMEQIPLDADSHSVGQEIVHILWKDFCVHFLCTYLCMEIVCMEHSMCRWPHNCFTIQTCHRICVL